MLQNMQPPGQGQEGLGEFWCSQGQDGLGRSSCRFSSSWETTAGAGRFCAERQCLQAEVGALSEEPLSEGPQDASPHRQPDNGKEWCAIAVPLPAMNAANATQATRRTHLLGIPQSSPFGTRPRNIAPSGAMHLATILHLSVTSRQGAHFFRKIGSASRRGQKFTQRASPGLRF